MLLKINSNIVASVVFSVLFFGCANQSSVVKSDPFNKIISPKHTTKNNILNMFGNPQTVIKADGVEKYKYLFTMTQENNPVKHNIQELNIVFKQGIVESYRYKSLSNNHSK